MNMRFRKFEVTKFSLMKSSSQILGTKKFFYFSRPNGHSEISQHRCCKKASVERKIVKTTEKL